MRYEFCVMINLQLGGHVVYHWVLSFIHILNILVPMWNCLDQLTSCMYTCNKGEERAMALHSPHPHTAKILLNAYGILSQTYQSMQGLPLGHCPHRRSLRIERTTTHCPSHITIISSHRPLFSFLASLSSSLKPIQTP